MRAPAALAFAALLLPALIAAQEQCVPCHPKEVETYRKTGMGRALSRDFPQPAGTFQHEISGTSFTVTRDGPALAQQVERDGLESIRRMDYAIGSGNNAFGFLVRAGDRLYQSPLSFYTGRKLWGMAPGYEDNPHPEFERPVTAECLWCHSGRPAAVPATLNRYRDPAFEAEAISCDRCHGPVDRHLAKPARETIVNPVRLAARARDSVCEQCHLSGEVRVLHPGRSFGDFVPGMQLEEVFSVYLEERRAGEAGAGVFKVVSHVEQLAASPCKIASGDRMWCGTCHNPHETPTDTAAYYRDRCLGCHDRGLSEAHPKPANDCAGCHMPRKQAYDSGHSAFTDHRIAKRPEPQGPKTPPGPLRSWREPTGPLAQRNLGLAYVEAGLKSQSAYQADRGLEILLKAMGGYPTDPEIPTALGKLCLLKNRAPLALELFEHVRQLEPAQPRSYQNLADALAALGRKDEAMQALERAVELDPYLEASYRSLAQLYLEAGRRDEATHTWDRYLELVPDSIFARQARRRIGESPSGGAGPIR